MILAQASVAGLYLLRHHPSPWRAPAPWLVGLRHTGGHRLPGSDGRVSPPRGYPPARPDRQHSPARGRDIFVGIGRLALALPFFTLAAQLGAKGVYGSTQPYLYPGLLAGRSLPLWAVIYSLSMGWIVWSPTEEMTYQAYALPRIQALSGRAWVAIVVVAFWWALQHSFIPLILDWRYLSWRFLAFLPGVTVFTLIYIRTRQPPPLIVTHWSLDALALVITLNF